MSILQAIGEYIFISITRMRQGVILERSAPRPQNPVTFFSFRWKRESYQKSIHLSEIAGSGRTKTPYNRNTLYQNASILDLRQVT